MSAIIIPRKHYTQPQGRVRLAQEWEGVVLFATIGDAQLDLKTGAFGTRTAFVDTGTSDGQAVQATAQQSGIGYPVRPIVAPQYSILAIAAPTTEARRQHIFFQGEESDPRYCQISLSAGMDWTGGNLSGALSLVEHDVDYRSRAHAIGAVDGARHVFSATRTQEGWIALYRDGKRLTLASESAVSNTATGVGQTWLGGASANNRGLAGPVSLCVVFWSALSDVVHAELAAAPWQLFRADPIRIYSLPTGAISINSITASNITQTGARITLGLTR